MADPVTGGCLCGAIRYTVSGPLRPVVACHCSQCRRTSGNFVAATSAARADLVITGSPVWYASSPDARRGFCGTCGSNLFWDGGGAAVSIHAGSLDDPAPVVLERHIYCADKARFYEIRDGLPQYPGSDL